MEDCQALGEFGDLWYDLCSSCTVEGRSANPIWQSASTYPGKNQLLEHSIGQQRRLGSQWSLCFPAKLGVLAAHSRELCLPGICSIVPSGLFHGGVKPNVLAKLILVCDFNEVV